MRNDPSDRVPHENPVASAGNGPLAQVPAPASALAARTLSEVPTPLITVEGLAVMLGVSTRGARLVLERGELPSFRLGRRLYVRATDFEAAIAEKIAARRQDRESAVRVMRGLSARKTARKP